MEGCEEGFVDKLGAFEGSPEGAAEIEGCFEGWLDGADETEGRPLGCELGDPVAVGSTLGWLDG